jgi:hypothetical protein
MNLNLVESINDSLPFFISYVATWTAKVRAVYLQGNFGKEGKKQLLEITKETAKIMKMSAEEEDISREAVEWFFLQFSKLIVSRDYDSLNKKLAEFGNEMIMIMDVSEIATKNEIKRLIKNYGLEGIMKDFDDKIEQLATKQRSVVAPASSEKYVPEDEHNIWGNAVPKKGFFSTPKWLQNK